MYAKERNFVKYNYKKSSLACLYRKYQTKE